MTRPAIVLALALASASPLAAQDRERIRARCDTGPASATACLEGALAVEALLGGVGLGASLGSDLPGSPSTLGRRYGSTPRWAFTGRVGAVQFDVPMMSGADPARARNVWAPALNGGVAAGVFDGFRLGPTVGGFLSVDLHVNGGAVLLPGGEGFDGAATFWGYGARVGLLRESFSLPAVTLAVARRHLSDVPYGQESDPGVVVENVRVTSYRASVGKEFVALGVLAGLGWDRARADGRVLPLDNGTGATDFDDGSAGRFLIFGALTRTWLVFQASAEAGFATGYDERPDGEPGAGAYDPTGGSFFGSLAFRLLY